MSKNINEFFLSVLAHYICTGQTPSKQESKKILAHLSYDIYDSINKNTVNMLDFLTIPNQLELSKIILNNQKISTLDKKLILNHIISHTNIVEQTDKYNKNILFYVKNQDDLIFLLNKTSHRYDNKLATQTDVFGKRFLFYYFKNSNDNLKTKLNIYKYGILPKPSEIYQGIAKIS